MISKISDPPIVAFSVRVYEAFLIAYPTKFRQEYGLQMAQVFQDCCLRTIRQSGTNGMVKLWMVTLLDLIQSVISEHAQKEAQMKKEMKPEEIRRSGWALILGDAFFMLSLLILMTMSTSENGFAILLFVFVSLPLLVYGVLGLRQRYGYKVGSFGKNVLLGGAILGPLTSLIGFFLLRVGEFWFLTFSGPAVLLACLTLYGVAALAARPMPSWNVLPILAGLWYPAIFFYYLITEATPPENLVILFFTIQGIALAALGYILKSDVVVEAAAPA